MLDPSFSPRGRVPRSSERGNLRRRSARPLSRTAPLSRRRRSWAPSNDRHMVGPSRPESSRQFGCRPFQGSHLRCRAWKTEPELPNRYRGALTTSKELVKAAQLRAHQAASMVMVEMFWEIGANDPSTPRPRTTGVEDPASPRLEYEGFVPLSAGFLPSQFVHINPPGDVVVLGDLGRDLPGTRSGTDSALRRRVATGCRLGRSCCTEFFMT